MIPLRLALLLFLSPGLFYCVEYYVKPTTPTNSQCPFGETCYTLQQYADNSSLISFQRNVSLLFLEGEHILEYGISITDIDHLVVAGFGYNRSVLSPDKFVIKPYLHLEVSIKFNNISFVILENIQIVGTLHSELALIAHTMLLDRLILVRFDIFLTAEIIHINNSNIFDCPRIIPCAPLFASGNTSLVVENSWLLDGSRIFFDYEIFEHLLCNSNHGFLSIRFSGCTVVEESGDFQTIFLSGRPGSTIRLELTNTSFVGCLGIMPSWSNSITLYVNRCTLKGPTYNSKCGALLYIQSNYRSNKNDIVLIINDTTMTGTSLKGLVVSFDSTFSSKVDVVISNSVISTHLNALVFHLQDEDSSIRLSTVIYASLRLSIVGSKIIGSTLALAVRLPSIYIFLSIKSCVFQKNMQVIYFVSTEEKVLSQGSMHPNSKFFIFFRNLTIEQNLPSESVVSIINVNRVMIEDCTFINNKGTVIEAYYSDITFTGNNLFANNTGIRGGALALYNSYIILKERSNTAFIGNHARDKGGALYVELFHEKKARYQFLCFFLTDAQFDWEMDLDVSFRDNTAVLGGDNIYGGTLYRECRFLMSLDYQDVYSRDEVDSMFHFKSKGTLSSISSDPTRACLCNDQGIPQCTDMDYIYREVQPRYPGEVFTVSAIVVGNDFGSVPGIVYSDIVQRNENTSLGRKQNVQGAQHHRQCTGLIFSIESPLTNTIQVIQLNASQNAKVKSMKQLQEHVTIYSKFKVITDTLLYHSVFVSVRIEECPTGFSLTTHAPYICECHHTLQGYGVTVCIIANHMGWVFRSGTVWVSASVNGNTTDGFVVHSYCPYDYCTPENTSVDLRFPDKQCAFHRSGILCGRCPGNFSVVLGTSRCKLNCDNSHISLIIVFIFAGFALVFFIKVLDLTVATGTINGLLFYANIVWANKSILFPVTESVHPALQILHTFIAWLNLDLGLETCFISGLTSYWKTWLQYLFPIYVWIIIALVIVASRYSMRASRIFGNNSVPVLATLILLSYAKLLRVIITSLSFSILYYPQSPKMVWSFDGNVAYFGGAHSVLFLVALAALLLLWLPYTVVLFAFQWLRRKSNLKPLRWLNRWKPFFDAYFGQLKPKHYHWIGLLLFVRVFLLVLFAATSAVLPRINILAIVSVGILLIVYVAIYGFVYKLRTLSLLEGSFIVNLTALGVAKLYFHANDTANTAIIYVSVGIVFLQFLAIVVFHSWVRIKSTYATYQRRRQRDTDHTDGSMNRELRVVSSAVHSHMHYREPLLESSMHDK